MGGMGSGVVAALLVWAATAQAGACGPAPTPLPIGPGEPRPPSSVGRFVYVTRTRDFTPDGSPAEQVRLAQITEGLYLPAPPATPLTPPTPPTQPRAIDVQVLLDTALDSAPRTVAAVKVSPNNTRVLVYSVEVPVMAIDHDLTVWRMATGGRGALFNEHSAAGYVNRATCPSPAFASYLSKTYGESPPALRDALDFSLAVEGSEGAGVRPPQILGWLDEERVALRWNFDILVSDGATLVETFDMIVRWPADGGAPSMTCARADPVPNPPTKLTLSGNPPRPQFITLRKLAVEWPKARTASKIAGIIWP